MTIIKENVNTINWNVYHADVRLTTIIVVNMK